VTSPPVVPPVQPEFHPEFGYLWPASHTRRIMRIGLFAAVFGAMIGGITAIAMTHRSDPDAARVQAARTAEAPRTIGAAPAANAAAAVTAATPTVAANPAVAAKNETPPASVETLAKPSAAAPPASAASTSTASTSCKEQTWPYLDSKCIKSNARKRQQVRVLKPETPPQSTPSEATPAAASHPARETTPAVKPPEPPKISKAREKKIAKSRESRRDREFAENARRRRDADPRDADRGPFVEPRRYEPRSAYASPYEPRYEVRGAWGW
jgi:hypothetical protein